MSDYNLHKLFLVSGHSSYEFRHQMYQFQKIKHEYVKSTLCYKLLNTISSSSNVILEKVSTHAPLSSHVYWLSINNTYMNIYKEHPH